MTIIKKKFCSLNINQFELPIFLGWPDGERDQKQIVSIDIHINLTDPPIACKTDKLEDTFCYSWLTNEIRGKIENQSFYLIEHLANTVLTIIDSLVPNAEMISVAVTKKPDIEGLKGGVTFSCVSFKESTST